MEVLAYEMVVTEHHRSRKIPELSDVVDSR
jgi:hypothetical protein